MADGGDAPDEAVTGLSPLDAPFLWPTDFVYDRSGAGPTAPGELVEIEPPGPLSASGVWRLQRDFYLARGPSAWTTGAVPQYATTNRVIADQFAQVVIGWCRDLRATGTPIDDPAEPVTILELGAGTGRFAFHLVTRLAELLEGSDLHGMRWRYVMTDVAASNIETWRAHPSLGPRLRREVEVAIVDLDADAWPLDPLLRPSRREGAPLVAIANYVFGSVGADCFAIGPDGTVREALLGLDRAARGRPPAGTDVLDGWRLRGEWRAVGPDRYEDGWARDALESYASLLSPGSVFTVPTVALRTIERLRRTAGDELLVLVADAGPTSFAQIDGAALPSFASHGSFSLPVNFDALGRAAKRQGGDALVGRDRQPRLEIVGLHLGARSLGSPSTSDVRGTATRAAFRRAIDDLGPSRFLHLEHALHLAFADFTFDQLAAAIRWALFDDVVFAQAGPTLRRLLAEGLTVAQRLELRELVDAVRARRFEVERDDEVGLAIDAVDRALDATG